MRTARASATVLVALVAFSGCVAAPVPSGTGGPSPGGPAPAASETISWTPCAETWSGGAGGVECATTRVPLDHDDPAGATIELALARVPATASPRLGTLFVNPGGPGASGRDYAAAFPRAGLEGYDILGWDPRGVGASTPVSCPADGDALLALDNSPDDAAETDALVGGLRAYAEACRAASGSLLDHLSARDSARDLDLLRRRLGDDRLSYVGASYGTLLGAAYVAEFPGLVGRLVLDAGVDPLRPVAVARSEEVTQAVAPERALDAFASWCAAGAVSSGRDPSGGCALSDDPAGRVAGLLRRLDAAPLPAADGRYLIQTLAAAGVVTLLGQGEDAWPSLTDAVVGAESGDPEPLLRAADAQTGRRSDGTHDSLAAFTATWCADDPVRTRAAAETNWQADRAQAPVFGETMGIPWMCVGWTATPAPPLEFTPPAGSILVLTQPGDGVTPTEWSRSLTDAVGGVLVAVDGRRHGSFGRGDACVDALVVATLTGVELPRPGASCP